MPHFRRHSGSNRHVTKFHTPFAAALAAIAMAGVFSINTLHAQAPKAPDTAVLSGAPLGAVTLSHAAHTKQYGAKCDNCHHASKPEKPMKGPQEKCSDCHTKTAAAPMKTKLQAAFHDPLAKKGTCIGCHQQAIAKGNTKAPSKCADCHKK